MVLPRHKVGDGVPTRTLNGVQNLLVRCLLERQLPLERRPACC